MSWVSIIWSMSASAGLTLAAMHLLVWCSKRTAWAHLLFFLTAAGTESWSGVSDRQRLVRIHSSKEEPAGAFVAVPYRSHWYWIDDRDLKTKRAFAFMMFLFTLADTGEKENLPLITIPAQ